MFQIGDHVYYASGGVCCVANICYAPLDGMPKDRQYYVLHSLHDANSVMYVPVNNEAVFLRTLMSREAAEALLEQIPTIGEIDEPNAKILRGRYVEAMRQHDPVEWVRVIKTVYRRIRRLAEQSKTQRISDTERSFAEDAKRYLYMELSVTLELPPREVEAFVRARVENPA